jgi:uncharacterized protein YecE (DUF72 family)
VGVYVGTSGWAYPEWRGAFYPPGLAQRSFLEHYAGELTACEVNATFYRIQSQETVARWAQAVPEGFRFTVKAHRRLSYRKRLPPSAVERAFVSEFLDSLEPLGERLGCLLIQFPPFVERDDAGLEELLGLLPADLRFACEFQHPSWAVDEVTARLAERGGTVCLREERGEVPRLPPGPLAYVRLKGERYGDEERDALSKLLASESRARDVYVFARHKDVAPDDPHTGLGLARWLARVEEEQQPDQRHRASPDQQKD